MVKHILKLIWNRRRNFVWIYIEQVLVFVVLFICFVVIGARLEYYLAPENLDVENMVSIGIMADKTSDIDTQDFSEKRNAFLNKVENSEYVEYIHKGTFTIPAKNPSRSNYRDSLLIRNRKYPFYVKTSDANFQNMFHVKMLEGVWFKDEAMDDGTYPVVLTKSLADTLKLDKPIGAKLNYRGRDFIITGIIHDYKSFTYDEKMPSAIFANSAFNDDELLNNIDKALRIKKGHMSDFIDYFWGEFHKEFPNQGHHVSLMNLEENHKIENLEIFLSLLIMIIPTLFLTVFAFLGTFSLLYRLSKKSFSEYGLRMALGSSKEKLRSLVSQQSLLLTLCAIVTGCIIFLNLYIFILPQDKPHIIIISLIINTLLMLSCATVSMWYPAYLASKTQPAVALKQED